MSMSNVIAQMILEMMQEAGETEIQRNELVVSVGKTFERIEKNEQ